MSISRNASLEWLRQAASTGFSCLPWFDRDPLLDPIRRLPAFTALMDQLRREQRAIPRTSS